MAAQPRPDGGPRAALGSKGRAVAKSGKEQLLAAATRLFAEKGFYGASIANIADEVGLTKQALLHHFGSKEALYAAVLQEIADALTERLAALQRRESDPIARLEAALIDGLALETAGEAHLRVLMRELLDNPMRAATARRWMLKPYLDALVAMLLAVPGLERLTPTAALGLVYQLVGAAHYFAISGPTLQAMYGPETYQAMRRASAEERRVLIRAVVATAKRGAAAGA
ncbi:MAG: TetR family transcriptional regulator [Pseudomonadota bacterium]